jgi:AraC-like DNA-binding protein
MNKIEKPVTRTPATPCWILHERARQHSWKGTGWLSIKTFRNGRAYYDVGTGHHTVDDDSYLVLNDGETYSINIESRDPVESFCLFFAPGFAEEVRRSVSINPETLLDEPDPDEKAPIRFFEKNYPHDRVLSPAFFSLRRGYTQHETDWLVEQFHGIIERLLTVHRIACTESKRLDAIRPATREEIYRRVCRARDYASALFAEPITLAELARAACLSPNHLLRTFRQVFGQTPHQFLVTRRLQEARRLLAHDDLPITTVCFAVGFESLGSFSSLFRKRFGLSPSEYRHAKK